jgi:membrane protein DedA with SNARE-associated domain
LAILPLVFDFLDGPVRELVTAVYEAVGYVGVALWVAIESVIVPIPSELVLPFAGFLVGEGASVEPLTGQPWNLLLTTIAGTIGAVVGALVAYAIGYVGGRPFLERWGRYLLISEGDLAKTDDFFARHGNKAAFFGRLIPVVRSLVSFAAGIAHMRLGPFILFTALGSLPWTFLLVFAGSQLGENWEEIGAFLKRFEYVVLGVLVLIVVAFVVIRIRRSRRPRPA